MQDEVNNYDGGGAGDGRITGNDRLFGQGSNDTFIAGAANILTGGAGEDMFIPTVFLEF